MTLGVLLLAVMIWGQDLRLGAVLALGLVARMVFFIANLVGTIVSFTPILVKQGGRGSPTIGDFAPSHFDWLVLAGMLGIIAGEAPLVALSVLVEPIYDVWLIPVCLCLAIMFISTVFTFWAARVRGEFWKALAAKPPVVAS